ncbi:MAG: hypothetical protein KDD73_07270 [Anaerolineales bacterium]|nr:hypothetical protein [Anaerolineales bacterium]MCB9127046.1 hypothetical protein [Ardenticatenales bacterium]MCB9172430.1 hypothetical protein [Ardenticatenales bacterium]
MSQSEAFPTFDAACCQELRAAAERQLQAQAPQFAVQGRLLLHALSPDQWPAEWHLPWWLGQSLRLDEERWQALTVANLLGLAHIFLADRLNERPATVDDDSDLPLAEAFHQAALALLHDLFDDHPRFWQHYAQSMAQWRQAQRHADDPVPLTFDEWQQDGLRLCAWRGAPLKITAVGTLLLAHQDATIPRLSQTLDQMLIAQVLLDHLDDWRDDLAAGRFNAFALYAQRHPSRLAAQMPLASRVLAMLMTGQSRGYTALVDAHYAQALRGSEGLNCVGLQRFLAAQRLDAVQRCGQLVDAAARHFQRAIRASLQP